MIQPSKSEYAKPVVITFKKYGSYQTSFIIPERQYKFLKTPFGFLVNPTKFLRLVDEVFKDLIRHRIIFMYVDDIIILRETEMKKHSRIY
uniref:Reverse transcriptase domain-containing protein n=1 Tax=Vespula pensylvanica TaxID=30213 RepID=A0A834PBQ4_VESPE|nr:hypothetical protein H0235_003224 [Vespula pensylvanica]